MSPPTLFKTFLNYREKIAARVAKEPGLVVLFLESYCDEPAVIAANIALKVSSGDPDYAEMSKEDAERDFRNRIKQYESVYETLTEPHLSYVKIINVGSQVHMYRIHGYLQSRIAFYLMNLHLKPRSIFMSRVRFCLLFESLTHVGGLARRKSVQRRGKDRWRCAPVNPWQAICVSFTGSSERQH